MKRPYKSLESVDTTKKKDNIESSRDIELEARVKEINEGKVKGIPAEEVFARLEERYRGNC